MGGSPDGGINFIAELFGHRVHPLPVDDSHRALQTQLAENCPFLTQAKNEDTRCTKALNSRGVCVVNTEIEGVRYDWLVCPHRALDQQYLERATRRLFKFGGEANVHMFAASTLDQPGTVEAIQHALLSEEPAILYFQEKLGGEVGIGKTAKTPSLSFDWTLLEIVGCDQQLHFGRFALAEIQTMDFHGSYKHAIEPTRERLQEDPKSFHNWVSTDFGQRVISRNMEGPNLSNVFKRTFYQLAYKFQLPDSPLCAGAALMLPEAVWTSWSRHLNNPELQPNGDGTYVIDPADRGSAASWVMVFGLDAPSAEGAPGRVSPVYDIQVSAETLIRLALVESPRTAVQPGGPVGDVIRNAQERSRKGWRQGVRAATTARGHLETPD